MSRDALGIDIGGTHIRSARVQAGVIVERRRVPCPREAEAVTRLCIELVAAMRGAGTESVGIGVPGQVDFAAKRVLSGGYVDLSSLPFAQRIAEATGLPVTIDNDATMALIGEAALGAARGLDNVVMLTIGTGIGGAILDHGTVLRGSRSAGQLGHLSVVPDGRLCVCGRKGCVETESSGTAFGVHLAEAGLPAGTTAEALLRRIGDPVADQVIMRWASPLRAAIDTLIATLAPDAVVIGGGAGAAAVAALGRVPARKSWFDAPVLVATLGDDAGVIGAALASRPKGRRVIMVNGVPASGKSAVAQAIAARSGWPVLALDTVKHPFLLELGPVDRLMNRRLGQAALQAIFALVAQTVPGSTLIVDAWFGLQPLDLLADLLAEAGIDHGVEIWCHAPPAEIGARYAARAENRPPGNPGLDYVPELVALAARAKPVGTFPVLAVDTTRAVDSDRLTAEIKNVLASV